MSPGVAQESTTEVGRTMSRDKTKEEMRKDKGDMMKMRNVKRTKTPSEQSWEGLGLHKMNKESKGKFKGLKAKAGAKSKQGGLDNFKQLRLFSFFNKIKIEGSNQGNALGNTSGDQDQSTRKLGSDIRRPEPYTHNKL